MYKDAFTTLTFLFFIRHFYIYLRLYQKVALEGLNIGIKSLNVFVIKNYKTLFSEQCKMFNKKSLLLLVLCLYKRRSVYKSC